MKKLLALVALVGFSFAVQVTFNVDLSNDPDIATDNTIAIQADFDGWWPGIVMDDTDGDLLYTVTVELEPGYYEYKFAGYEWSTSEFPDWGLTEAEAGPCLTLENCTGAEGECQFINRYVDVGAEDLVIEPVCWTTCEACVAPAGGELINGSFEDQLEGWGGDHNANYFVDGTGAAIYNSDDFFEAYDGLYGLKIWGRFDGTPVNEFSQEFVVSEGNELTLSGFVFSHPDDAIGAENEAYLSLTWYDDARAELGSDESVHYTALDPLDVWTELSVIATAPAGATHVKAAVNYLQVNSGDGSTYWDAIDLSATSPLDIAGCTDSEAFNYNPYATFDDGSCLYDDDFVSVTFNLDMNCEGDSPDPFLAGGGTFGNPGDNPMVDPDGDGIYTITVHMEPNSGTDYTFTNGACGDWSCKESIAGQDCATEPWSDRHIDVGTEDVVVNTCFGQCVDGSCGECPDPGTGDCLEGQVAVTFYVDLSENPEVAAAHTIALMGEFNGWWPGDIMEDLGDYVYGTTVCLGAETDYEYKFAGFEWTISEFPDAMYPVGEPPCPGTTSTVECQYGTCTNRLLTTDPEDMVLDAVYWAGCETYTYTPTPMVTFGVDLSLNPDIAGANTIALQSDFGGWWPGIIMDDPDGDLYYEVTVPLEPGYYEYKFAGYEWSTTEFEDWSFTAENAPECLVVDGCTGDNGECQFINRFVDVTETVELDGVYWGTCDIVESVPQVTFQVDMSQNPDIAAAHTISLQSDFAGWWPGIPMDDSDGDLVYTLTVELEPGSYQYKFAGYEWSTTEFPDWSMTEADAGPCLFVDNCVGDNGECQFINRIIDVTGDVVLDEACWASCEDCPDVQPTYVDVTFQVDMSYENTEDGVYLAGGTIGSEDAGVPSMGWLMDDLDGDNIFTRTLSLLSGSHVNFKYRTQPSYGWEGNWENVPAECGEGTYLDRWVDVDFVNMVLDPVCFASCEACGEPPAMADVTFQVNMAGVEVADGVTLHASFDGWGAIPMTDEDGDCVYSVTVPDLQAGGTHDYLFQNGGVNETVPNTCATGINDWGGGVNRQFVVPEVDTIMDPVCINMCIGDVCEGGCGACGDGDMNEDGSVDVLDVVAMISFILETSELDFDFGICHGDLNDDGSVDILDAVTMIDWILHGMPRAADATEAMIFQNDHGVEIQADGYIGAVQIELAHGRDFQLTLPEDAMVADYATKDNRTTVLVAVPGTQLFSAEGDFEIIEVLAASGSDYVNVVIVDAYNLLSNHPNPFNPSTTVQYIVPQEGMVKLAVYNVLGRQVSSLVNEVTPAGSYSVNWNGADEAGNPAPSGIYFVRMEHAGGVDSQKMMLLK